MKQTGLEEGKAAGSRGRQVSLDLRVPAEVDYTCRHQLQILDQILVKGLGHILFASFFLQGSGLRVPAEIGYTHRYQLHIPEYY